MIERKAYLDTLRRCRETGDQSDHRDPPLRQVDIDGTVPGRAAPGGDSGQPDHFGQPGGLQQYRPAGSDEAAQLYPQPGPRR